MTVQPFPSIPLYIAWQKACQSPSVFLNVINIDASFQRFDFFSSQCQIIRSFPCGRLWVILAELRLLDMKRALRPCANDPRPPRPRCGYLLP